jgi:chromosome segregation ATPase
MAASEKSFVTREAVFAEADRQKAAGVEPSNRTLLRALGGSMTTIAGHFREYKARQDIAAPVAPENIEVPTSVIDAGKQAVGAIWQVCHAEARREIELLTEQANQRVKEAENERDKVLGELAEAETELGAAHGKTDDLEGENASLRQAVSGAASNEAGLRATVDQMERQIAAQTAELQRVHIEHDQARQTYSGELVRVTADFARQLAEHIDAARAAQNETASVRQKLEDKTTTLQHVTERERDVVTDLIKAQGDAARIATQLEDAKAAFAQVEAALREQLVECRDQFAALTRQRDAAADEREALRLQASEIEASLREQLAVWRDRVSSLTAQRDAAAGERDTLRGQVSSQLEVIAAFANAPPGDAGTKGASGKAPVSGRKPQKPSHTG